MLASMGWAVRRTALLLFDVAMILVPDKIERRLRTFFQVFPRDVRSLYILIRVLWATYNSKRKNYSILNHFKEVNAHRMDQVCLIFEEEKWSFRKLDEYSDRIAALFSKTMTKGDTVSIFVTNRPEYVGLWLGFAKIGVASCLINTNMKHKSLSHCISVTKSNVLIYSKDLENVVGDAYNLFEKDMKCFCIDGEPLIDEASYLETLTCHDNFDAKKLPYTVNFNDHMLYIYTSGTTGLPKPAIISHAKMILLNELSRHLIGVCSEDIIYNCMPLYHISGCAGINQLLMNGCTNVIKKKFSASSYISDCIKHNVTIGQYIGEMCRYLLKTEIKEGEKNHKIKMMSGNGIRADVWRKFSTRFNVKTFREYYGATEGNVIRVNTENIVGSCGFLPQIIPFSEKIFGSLILVHEETGEPLRTSNGLCIKAPAGKPGMVVGLIPSSKDSIKKFDGYVNKDETEKKIIRNVFKEGDKAFASGDLLVMDHLGNLYFHERLGDTFRWKGENVSTTELENIITDCNMVEDCVVYGVKVPGEEGTAGMCALISHELNLDNLFKHLESKLPQYAMPVFLRLVKSFEYTNTFKKIKFKFKQEAFDYEKVTDKMYVRQKKSYIPLDQTIYQLIKTKNYTF